MRQAMHHISALRWGLLLFVLPAPVAWAATDGSGGWLGVVTLAALVLFAWALNDASHAQRGAAPALSLAQRIGPADESVAIRVRTWTGALTLALALAMLIAEPFLGFCAVIAALLILALAWLDSLISRRRQLWLAEITLPLASIIAPMALVNASVRDHRLSLMDDDGTLAEGAANVGGLPLPVVALGLLSALAMTVYVLACLIRDEARDAGDGKRTTPTILGIPLSMSTMFAWTAAITLLGAWGVAHDHWHWAVAGIYAIASSMCLWSSAARAMHLAPPLWTLAQLLVVLIALITAAGAAITA